MARPEPDIANTKLMAYCCLLDNARAMLKAAQEERWDDLSMLESERQSGFERVVQADLTPTCPTDIEAKTELIQNILDYDEQTRVLVRAWQSELSAVLGSVDNERKLFDAYRSG